MRLKIRELAQAIPEYNSVLTRAANEGWLDLLLASHMTPCTVGDAEFTIRSIPRLPNSLEISFRNKKGRAKYRRRTGTYRIALPNEPGTYYGKLRVGIVLHEAAHVVDHLKTRSFGHGQKFCDAFRQLLQKYEGLMKPTGNWKEIYARHQGPYSILLANNLGGKQGSDWVKGPLTAEQAHEQSREAVTDPKRPHQVGAYVFSDKEGLYIGAIYQRGHAIEPWNALADVKRVEVPAEQPEGSLLPGGPQLVRTLDDTRDGRLHSEPGRAGVPHVRQTPRSRGGTGLPLGLNPDNDKWPGSPAAQAVKEVITNRGAMSAKALAEEIAAPCTKHGVAHPASLISRLKQAGLLIEVHA